MRITIGGKTLWTVSLVLYIICSTAFSYGRLRNLNTVALYFFFGVSVLYILKRGKFRVDFGSGAIIAYLLLSLIGMLYTPTSQSKVWDVIYNCITMTVLSVCIVQYIENEKDLHVIIFAYMIAGLALALYVYSIYGSSFWYVMRNAAQDSADDVIRLGNELTNENAISFATAVSSIIAVYYLIFTRKSTWKTVACTTIGLFCFMVSMAAASKKGVLFLLVCIFGMWLYSMYGTRDLRKQTRNVVLFVAAAAVVVWAISSLPIFSGIAQRFTSLFSFLDGGRGTSSERVRANMITEGFSVWLAHPLFGAGAAASIAYFGVYSHSNLIEVLMNSGIVGFCVFYSPYVYSGRSLVKKAVPYKSVDKLPILLFALLLGITVSSIAIVYYYDRYYMNLLITIFAAVRVYDSKLQEQQ